MFPFPPLPSSLERTAAWWRGQPLDMQFIKSTLDLCERLPKEPATVGGGTEYNAMTGIRDSDIAWVPFPGENNDFDTKSLYETIGQVMVKLNEDHFKFQLWGFIDRLQYTVYDASKGGQHYGWHVDHHGAGRQPRKLSFSLFLSEPFDYEGGDLKLAGTTPMVAGKELGLMVAFPSYTSHKVDPVTKGIRRSLVGWVSGWEFR